MREPELKSAVYSRMLRGALLDGRATGFEEMILGQSLARIDYVLVGARLHGYELKSASDTLKRLPEQIGAYGPYFERLTLIADERHCAAAVTLLPSWWGLTEVRRTRMGTIGFHNIRTAVVNPSIDPSAVVTLLWPFEMIEELDLVGKARGWRGKPTYRLWDQFYATFSSAQIMAIVKRRLRARRASSIDPLQR